MSINIQSRSHLKSFELVMVMRDRDGNPTGKTRTIVTDESDKLYDFYMRNKGKPKRKKKNKVKKDALPNASQADRILAELYSKENE